MFLYRFKHHKFRAGRVGTMAARGLGASALSSVVGIKEALNMSYGRLFSYMPLKSLTPELNRLVQPEHQDDIGSYTHYIKSMGFVLAQIRKIHRLHRSAKNKETNYPCLKLHNQI